MVIFDVNISVGRWPFRPSEFEDAGALDAKLHKEHISGGLIRAAEAAFTSDLDEDNARLFAKCQSLENGLFIPLPAVHPAWNSWKNLGRLPAAALYPGFHRYHLDSPECIVMATCMAASGVVPVVVLREEDERAQNPLCRIPVVPGDELRNFALALHGHPVMVLGAYYGEIIGCAAVKNLFFDLSFAETLSTVNSLINAGVQPENLLFGSHTPYFCTSSAISKVSGAETSELVKEKIFYKNAERILNV